MSADGVGGDAQDLGIHPSERAGLSAAA
jgi:hypothetical protein